jgi:chalcone isomerase
VLEPIIGEHGVSPAAKLSIATRVSELLNGITRGGDRRAATG